MKPLTMFQRALLMYMVQEERLHGEKRVGVMRNAIEWALQFTWQNHYTIATEELKELGWIEVRNYFGKHMYVLTEAGRSNMTNFIERAGRVVRVTTDQTVQMFSEGEGKNE